MKVNGDAYRALWLAEDGWSVEVIDQKRLPHRFEVARLRSIGEVARAIAEMQVRGAPLIGAAAAYGVCLALRDDPSDASLDKAMAQLGATRPTAINLRWALGQIEAAVRALPVRERAGAAYRRAAALCEADVETNRKIGEHGTGLIRVHARRRPGEPVHILTHCNAGWLATVDGGTALSPIYQAHDAGVAVHVWVDETRPRNQGAALTAWELGSHGVPHTVIVDNAGGHLMQHGRVDLCLVGTDRTTATGDVANKIGTYLKALAARDNNIPFYVALPSTTIDWSIGDGVEGIPIEERSSEEVTHVTGRTAAGACVQVEVAAPGSLAKNFAFDVTPGRLVTGLITERGICEASREGLLGLFPSRRAGPPPREPGLGSQPNRG